MPSDKPRMTVRNGKIVPRVVSLGERTGSPAFISPTTMLGEALAFARDNPGFRRCVVVFCRQDIRHGDYDDLTFKAMLAGLTDLECAGLLSLVAAHG